MPSHIVDDDRSSLRWETKMLASGGNADRPPLARTASEVTVEGRARPHRDTTVLFVCSHSAGRLSSVAATVGQPSRVARRPLSPGGRWTVLQCRLSDLALAFLRLLRDLAHIRTFYSSHTGVRLSGQCSFGAYNSLPFLRSLDIAERNWSVGNPANSAACDVVSTSAGYPVLMSYGRTDVEPA